MTYFAFLAIFLGVPIAALSLWTIADYKRGKWNPRALSAWRPWVVIVGLCAVAFVYTTPWDNYLVASGVWYYDVDLVTGIVFGWVPIEEYTFFILLPIMTGLFTLVLIRYLPINAKRVEGPISNQVRFWATAIVSAVWVVCTGVLILTFADTSWQQWRYFGLLMSWALLPVMLQTAFGADIFLRHWRVVVLGIAVPSLYLSWADSLAITAGTWTIAPLYSVEALKIGGVLPFEEALFFTMVNVLVVIGMVLVLAEESQERALSYRRFRVMRPVIDWIMRGSNHAGATGD
ncbi:MAG: lycopene cyclase domain-containing protein [Anaerolineae bacterium]|nr:lycopene cyclase domain-containing protein [Anaerolineae bacterium]